LGGRGHSVGCAAHRGAVAHLHDEDFLQNIIGPVAVIST
jgi:hypothetical protein